MDARRSFPVSSLDYDLPPERIAQSPPARREDARLLIVDRQSGGIEDGRIPDLTARFQPGDLLVLNDTKVLPAKLAFHRATGGRIEGLFLEELSPGRWAVMLDGARRLRAGEAIHALGRSGRSVSLTVTQRLEEGRCVVRVEPPESAESVLDDIGMTPLPPYIRRGNPIAEPQEFDGCDPTDRERYQTVYARSPGAVAAPTAGFHLTKGLLDSLKQRGVEIACVTLHVGVGTFKPVTVDDLVDHPMHAERYEYSAAAAEAIERCKTRRGRVIAVGTTSVRVLETVAREDRSNSLAGTYLFPPRAGSTRLLLYPSCEFRVVDALLTNFHLPRSTLLALVMAFAGIDLTRRAYAHAIAERYRFYSYGDAMLVL